MQGIYSQLHNDPTAALRGHVKKNIYLVPTTLLSRSHNIGSRAHDIRSRAHDIRSRSHDIRYRSHDIFISFPRHNISFPRHSPPIRYTYTFNGFMMDAMHSETVAYWITIKGLCYRDIHYVLKHERSICLRLRHLQLQRRNHHCAHAAVNFIQ